MMNKLTDSQIPELYLIGGNGAGKSYTLNTILSRLPNEAIYISEEGIAHIKNQKNKVAINTEKGLYVYIDEKTRGNNTKTEQQKIEEKSLSIIHYCNAIITNLKKISNKSQGQKKLQNIMEIFTNYNLNNLKFILFDEPENFLDEEYLKVIANLIKILIEKEFNIRVATHNSRLLAILQVNIDNIAFFVNREVILISSQEVYSLFNEVAAKIENERISKKYNIDPTIQYKLEITKYADVFVNYIENNLKSIEFYRCLFYQEVFIIEGISDLEALNSISNSFNNSVNIYCPNGKAWIPFYTMLFKKLKKKISIIIDVDSQHASVLTTVLDSIDDIKVIKHDPDMETFYGIIDNIL